jgi:hypothetical protein
MLQTEIEKLSDLEDRFAESGADLMKRCGGSIFPCDALALTVLTRAINLSNGFILLIEADYYECAVGLVRFQLDNVLRLFGVTTCKDPHGIASRVIKGTSLRTLRHNNGEKMTDAFLVAHLGEHNAWLPDAYRVLSGFIHLSEQHFQHMLMQSERSEDGLREFVVSDKSAYISGEQKVALVRTFSSVTRGTISLIKQWADVREQFGTPEQLKARFSEVV